MHIALILGYCSVACSQLSPVTFGVLILLTTWTCLLLVPTLLKYEKHFYELSFLAGSKNGVIRHKFLFANLKRH